MKILNILNEITFSGAEVMLKVAAPAFKRAGFEPHVLSTGSDGKENASDCRKRKWSSTLGAKLWQSRSFIRCQVSYAHRG